MQFKPRQRLELHTTWFASFTIKNRRPPSDELLHTLLIEAENVINSRPLTQLPLELTDEGVITPNHLLICRLSADAPIEQFNDTALILRKQWRAAQRLADVFFGQPGFVPTFLLYDLLLLRPKLHKLGRRLTVGDVVLIVDSNEPRDSWPNELSNECTKALMAWSVWPMYGQTMALVDDQCIRYVS